MEKDIGFHGREEGEPSNARCFVEEIGACDLAICAVHCSLSNNHLHQVHLPDHILESADIGIGDLAAGRDVAEGVQVLEKVVGELVSRSLEDDALEVLGLDISIAIFVEVVERLSYPFSLQPSQHLCELWVCQVVSPLLPTTVQGCPLAVPIKRYAIRALVDLIQLLQIIVLDCPRTLDVK